ncbi:histidine kinase [Draconibacterium sp. IB214405]|uniref:sensor histidine kinase n=1 Tax=Draconibacterium sp. IB214405 TaxID=3097352 RepID=UPI002A16C75E|nr:histidine kinase [Draconibacterium sp. IB214405]MDX8338702.1 histidine kinase [Draconibacterium sp. IB214405]
MQKHLLNKRNKIIGHVLFWMASIVFLCFIFFIYSRSIDIRTIAKSITINAGFAVGVYFNLYILIPRFLIRKQYIYYIFWLVVLISVSSLFIQFIIIYLLRAILDVSEELHSISSETHSAFFFATLFYVSITTFLKLFKDWLSLQDINYQLAKTEKQKLEAELKSLKGQLNPHFLFNSLNNIYSLSLMQSEKVPDLILRLSDLMRHIIYESRDNFISLNKEIEFVDNFIALQKIRTADDTVIEYKKPEFIPTAKIAPLLFEPFIDNAFKHGLPGTENDFIKISFEINNDILIFRLENNYSDAENHDKKNSGIGIYNVKQRLKHLYGKDDYQLLISRENALYSVQLKLKLKYNDN